MPSVNEHFERVFSKVRRCKTAFAYGEYCQCVTARDIYIAFPNGLKRPDIALFCREPNEEKQDRPLTMIPEAVIEVVSKGFEAKDLEIGPPFYLSQGVKDVVVFDPSTPLVLHVKKARAERHLSPVDIRLQCGCRVRA